MKLDLFAIYRYACSKTIAVNFNLNIYSKIWKLENIAENLSECRARKNSLGKNQNGINH